MPLLNYLEAASAGRTAGRCILQGPAGSSAQGDAGGRRASRRFDRPYFRLHGPNKSGLSHFLYTET